MFKTTYDEKNKVWKGPDLFPYYDRNCSFGRIAFEEMRRRPDHICQISDSENISLTNEEARLQAIRMAKSFERLGITQNDIIGIAGRNTTYLMSVIVGCFFHGNAYHAINPNYGKQTSKKLFEITKPKIVFCDGQDLEKIQYAVNELNAKIYTLKNHVEGIPTVMDLLIPTGDEKFYRPAKLEKGTKQTLAVLCSSGTSGTPKAVTFPNCSFALRFAEGIFTDKDIMFASSTQDWASAFLSLSASLVYGFTRIITDLPFTTEYYLEILEKYKVTNTMCSTPTMTALSKLKEATPEKLKNLRFFFYGGSKIAINIQEKVQSLLENGIIVNNYGCTEFGGVAINFNFKEKPEAVGLVCAGVQVCIVNENGQRCGPNEPGEIWAHHGEYWGGYYNNKEATNEMLDENGWFHTGDKGYFDNDNYLFIVDRIKELLKYQRMQYYPSQVEDVIAKMPGVKDVCVFGIQCTDGEMAAAAVVPMDDSSIKPEDVIEFVKNNEEDSFKHLHGGCKLFKEIPKTANLKHDRKAAKALFLENT